MFLKTGSPWVLGKIFTDFPQKTPSLQIQPLSCGLLE
jgi:hypothetical protein